MSGRKAQRAKGGGTLTLGTTFLAVTWHKYIYNDCFHLPELDLWQFLCLVDFPFKEWGGGQEGTLTHHLQKSGVLFPEAFSCKAIFVLVQERNDMASDLQLKPESHSPPFPVPIPCWPQELHFCCLIKFLALKHSWCVLCAVVL